MSHQTPREPAPYLRPLSPVIERRLVLPLREGAQVHVRLASRWERLTAFFVDTLLLGSVQLLTFALFFKLGIQPDGLQVGLAVLAVYLLQTFYFSTFETIWNGQSPGKRLLELRTVRLDGEALSPWVLWIRSNVRMMEHGWPILLTVLTYFTARSLFPFIVPFAALVFLLSLLFPFLNVHNQRLADFIAGTVVIEEPERITRFLPPFIAGADGPTFPTAMLHRFGTYELHAIDSVLAQARAGDDRGLLLVGTQLCKHMGQPTLDTNEVQGFVEAFHRQLAADIAQNARDPKARRWR